jgi:protein involved in polysaccharide export with SLBB domain
MNARTLARSLLGIASLVTVLAGAAAAQTSVSRTGVGTLQATRADLERTLAGLDERMTMAGGRSDERAALRAEAELLRHRLQEGDFQPGDQIALFVDGHQTLSTTYTVEPTRTITLPGVGIVPLRGVLRSELEGYLSEYLGQFVRSPLVRASSTIRLLVVGGVAKPGYYAVPSHALVTDVIDEAGGTGRQSLLTRMRIERDGERVVAGRQLHDAIIAGRTLDQLNVQAGDRIVVPESRTVQVREVMGVVGGLGGIATLIWTIRGRRW